MYIELKTERLLLRPASTADWQATFAYTGDAELTRYMTWFPHENPEETLANLRRAEAAWQKDRPDFFEFVVLLNGVQIGGVSLWLDETHTEGELGWIFHRNYWGCGYAAESAKALRDFAFSTLGLHRVTASCDTRNIRSTRVRERIGMKLVRTDMVRQYKKRDETATSLLYALEAGHSSRANAMA